MRPTSPLLVAIVVIASSFTTISYLRLSSPIDTLSSCPHAASYLPTSSPPQGRSDSESDLLLESASGALSWDLDGHT